MGQELPAACWQAAMFSAVVPLMDHSGGSGSADSDDPTPHSFFKHNASRFARDNKKRRFNGLSRRRAAPP